MRGKLIVGMTLLAVLTVSVGVALATFQPTVLYKPPVIKMKDHNSHMSEEDIAVRRAGSDFTVTATSSPPTIDPASDPGCEFISGGVSCPRAGVKKILLVLGAEDDTADIDLGASADKVKQILKGQDDEDGLFGAGGTQKLVGGSGADLLIGGRGKDILIGGPGLDACDGGPGKDVVKQCEQKPLP